MDIQWVGILNGIKRQRKYASILEIIDKEKQYKTVYPSKEKALNMFTIPARELKVIFVFKKPFKNCTGNIMEGTVYNKLFFEYFNCLPDYEHLRKQGVGFISEAIVSCERWENNKDLQFQEPLFKFIFDEILFQQIHRVYVFVGSQSDFIPYINLLLPTNNKVMMVEGLEGLPYQRRKWNHEYVFERINMYLENLKHNEKKPIKWIPDFIQT